MSIRTFGASDAINEATSARYACTLTDQTGAAIDPGAVSAITATLKDSSDGTVINSRTAQSVLNTNGGTLSAGGAFALVLSAADTVARGTAALQPRRLTLAVTFTTGTLCHEVNFFVRSLADIS